MNASIGDRGGPRAVLWHEQSDGRVDRTSGGIPRTRHEIEDVDFVAPPREVTRSKERDELLQARDVDAARAKRPEESVWPTRPALRLLHRFAVDARPTVRHDVIRRGPIALEQSAAIGPRTILGPHTTSKRLCRDLARGRRRRGGAGGGGGGGGGRGRSRGRGAGARRGRRGRGAGARRGRRGRSRSSLAR